MLSEGRVLLRGAGLQVRDHAPLGAFSSWLSWEWFRAAPLVQHAIGPALLLALVASLFSLLRAAKVSAPVAAVASLALSLHPCAADLSAPLAGRDALLALALSLLAARRSLGSPPVAGIAWSASAALLAGLCAPGYGLFGLLPASFVRPRAHEYPLSGSYLSSALVAGNLQSRVSVVFDQATWDTEYKDIRVGPAAEATFDHVQYPIAVKNRGAVTEKWIIHFLSNSTIRIIGENLGQVVDSFLITTQNGICRAENKAAGTLQNPAYYFEIDANGFGGG